MGGILQTKPNRFFCRKCKNHLHCLNFHFFFFFLLSSYLNRVQESLSVGSTSTPLPNTHTDPPHTSPHSHGTHTSSRIHSSSSSSLIRHSSQRSLTDSPSSRKRSWISTDLSDKSNFEPKNLLSLFDETTLESKPWVGNATFLLVYNKCVIFNVVATWPVVRKTYKACLNMFKPGLMIFG